MKTSARNHLYGTIIRVDKGPVENEVTIMLDGSGAQIVAIVTRARSSILRLDIGVRVMVLIKTHDVFLITEDDDVILSARNQMSGTILGITESNVSADVRVRLDGGGILSAVITMESVREMDLVPGSPIKVVVRASNVVIGVLKKENDRR